MNGEQLAGKHCYHENVFNGVGFRDDVILDDQEIPETEVLENL